MATNHHESPNEQGNGGSLGMKITAMFRLNIPRGTLVGNSNPIDRGCFTVNMPTEVTPPFQAQIPTHYFYQTLRALEHKSTSPYTQVSPIFPCPQLANPPFNSSHCNPDHSSLYNTQQLESANQLNTYQNGTGVFCPSTDLGLANLQNLFALQRESELMEQRIEHTARLLLAVVDSPEVKTDEPPQFPQPHNQIDTQPTIVHSGDTMLSWSGELPPRRHHNPTYSPKVFLASVPWNITEEALVQSFSKFGCIKIEWPGIDQFKGYVYIIFEAGKKVKELVDCCRQYLPEGGGYYYTMTWENKSKDVVVVPWALSDSYYARLSHRLDPGKTVFVGGLHGTITAESLATIMNDLFGGVISVELGRDTNQYPIGSAKIFFNNYTSYMKAVKSAFIDIKTRQFRKKVQVEPFLVDSRCSMCNVQNGSYFCREVVCFKYYCQSCWDIRHLSQRRRNHNKVSKRSKEGQNNFENPLLTLK